MTNNETIVVVIISQPFWLWIFHYVIPAAIKKHINKKIIQEAILRNTETLKQDNALRGQIK